MQIVIIEDEKLTAENLINTIKLCEPDAEIVTVLRSVKSGIEYFSACETPDLIFSDIQLGDGLSFEIFQEVKTSTPIIFCTAFDEYALNAFKTNSIDYVLKPFSEKEIRKALEKYKDFRDTFLKNTQSYKEIIESLLNRNVPESSSILVHYKDKIVPVKLEHIALFYLENEISYLITFEKEKYSVNKTLDDLSRICGSRFFRANRQCLLNRKAVIDVSQYFSRKLSVNIKVPFQEKITISKEKTPYFLSWLEEEN